MSSKRAAYSFLMGLNLLLTSMPAAAIDGPNALAISNANWGTAADQYPHVARLEIDLDNNGSYNGAADTHCTGTLIAPDVMVTAGHCFRSFLNPGNNIPANRVRANFGAVGTILNAGGRVHPAYSNIPGPDQNDLAYIILGGTPNAAVVSPISLLPRPARVNDTNYAVGFGVGNASGAGPAGAPSFGITQHNGGAPGRNAGAKGWATINVDNVTANHVQQTQDSGEDFTEGGDSGGPGIQRHIMPNRAWGSNIVNFARNDFAMSAVDGGNTPGVSGGAFNYDTNPGMPGIQSGSDSWTRLDTQGNFLNEAIALGATTIFHNMPSDPMSLNPNDPVKVLIRSQVNGLEPYTLNIKLWEEDNEPAAPYRFSGDLALQATNFNDDLAGFGHSAGVAPLGVSTVCAWQELTVGDLISYDEDGNPQDPPLDWVFQINYADAGQSVDPLATALPLINAQIAGCEAQIAAGAAIRGGFAMVPEPATLSLVILASLALIRRRN
ncbi:MAG TPA: trypsin-like serine protease [Phycisphaerae bacterium]|nr:trypsin-like serine protease [Phycisphaerae bacterium]